MVLLVAAIAQTKEPKKPKTFLHDIEIPNAISVFQQSAGKRILLIILTVRWKMRGAEKERDQCKQFFIEMKIFK